MAETSGLWTTSATPSGHQVVSYTQALATDMLAITAACSGFEGVAPGYLNELAPSTTGNNNCRIATGGAMVDGKYYKNSANADINIPNSAATFRIDRVVVEVTWASFEAVLTRIPGAEDSATPPVVPSTAGTNYAILICQAYVTAAGVVTITDERKWAIVDTDESTLEDSAGVLRVKDLGITTAKIAAEAVTAAKIENRTRKVIVPPLEWPQETGAGIVPYGSPLADSVIRDSNGVWIVPNDFVSGLTAKVIYYSTGSGNAYLNRYIYYGAAAEAYNTHSSVNTADVVAITANQNFLGASNSLSNASAGDIVTFHIEREGSQGTDTLAASLYIRGWLMEYTADS